MPTRYFSGWRAGLARCTAVASIVTAINITFLLVAIPRLSISASGSSEGALFSGDCKRAKQLSIWLHLAINILATALLAAGNYTQQVLTAPTRSEINIGHSQERWLDIGVSSLHNLRQISGKRVAAWILLALTSVPIHLLYNSILHGVNRYSIYPAMWDDLNDPDHQFHDNRYKALRNTLDEFERLENHECIAAYGPEFISDRSDVILILDPSTPDRLRNYTSVAGGDPMDYGTSHNTWICRQGLWSSCGDMSLTNAKNWSIYAEQPDHYGGETLQVEYCLSKRTPEHCKLILSIPLLGVVHIGGSTSLVELWNRGFGRVSLDTLIDFREIKAEGLISMVLISNLPQLILSLLYAALNFGHQRKTYWLSLPLRYGAPLIAGSATMHWFISQSIFFVRLALYQDEKRYYPREGNITTCGYSPIAIIFSIGLGSLILLITVAWSLRTMKSAIPLGGTCSAVVSAACHSPEGDEHGALELVKWGVVHGEDGGPWERCSITSWPAEAPEYGRWYR
ncbi:hypothetical protein H9L39_20196 [Fusarium oxysporum f. sp. albedinis]|nr:hypothetical protein H9L39_20196 [Fusarium oxysporum f. sp. albedinis]